MDYSRYDWKRFWYTRDVSASLSDDGYLADPDALWGTYMNPTAITLDQLNNVPCLVLLGEPGLGKTDALRTEYLRREQESDTAVDAVCWIDLFAYQSDTRLENAILKHPMVSNWLAGSHRLYLYLDSLDEALLRIDTVCDLLTQILEQLPQERLSIRITCRSADWPEKFESDLRQLWRLNVAPVYVLAPLRRIDIATAARIQGIDDNAFLTDVERANATPLAIKPITLKFLLNSYQHSGQLPHTQQELYEKGCHLLCEEANTHRRGARQTGKHSSEERLATASCLAAVMTYSNFYAIWIGLDAGNVPEVDVSVHEIYAIFGKLLGITESVLRETLSMGLFSAPSADERTWAHQTYREFLAARFVSQHMSPRQAQELFMMPDGKIAPQLSTVAAWIATLMPDTFKSLVAADPASMLRADVAAMSEPMRAVLVTALLKMYEIDGAFDNDHTLRKRYSALAHPTLADQLHPYLSDKGRGIIVRRVAIEIAEACQLHTEQHNLIRLALDPSEPPHLRSLAIHAIGVLGNMDVPQLLRPLAFGEAGDDPDDDVKGNALRVLWPMRLSAKELFAVLTPPKDEHYYGSYAAFLLGGFEDIIAPQELSYALEWAEQYAALQAGSYLHSLVDKVLRKAWAHIEEDDILNAFVRVALRRLESHQSIISVDDSSKRGGDQDSVASKSSEIGIFSDNEEQRRRLLSALVLKLADSDVNLTALLYRQSGLVTAVDVPWLIQWLRNGPPAPIAAGLTLIIAQVTNVFDPDQLDAILLACQEIPVLEERFRWLLAPVALDSPEAQQQRAHYQKMKEFTAENTQNADQQHADLFDFSSQILLLLGTCESGEVSAWSRIHMLLSATPDGRRSPSEAQGDVTTLPNWQACNDATQQRIIQVARRYILELDPQRQGWLTPSMLRRWMGQNITFFSPAFAGYRALILLARYDPGFLSGLSTEIWRQWAPIIVTFPSLSEETTAQNLYDNVLRYAYHAAPDAIIATFLAQCRQQNRETGTLRGLHQVRACWDERFSGAILAELHRKTLRPLMFNALLTELVDHETLETRNAVRMWIKRRTRSQAAYARAISVASALISSADDAGWPDIWPILRQDSAFARDIFLSIHTNISRSATLATHLAEEQVADLFLLVVALFPPDQDPPLPNGFVTPEQRLVIWRSSLITTLVQRRTRAACIALRHIVQALPTDIWLKSQLLEVEDLLRHDTWNPVSLTTLAQLVASQEARLVENEQQLIEVLIESLIRLDKELQGETAASLFLWDEWSEDGQSVYKPKKESALSDYIKLHLERDLKGRGIIANREVEIRRGIGGQGERTDVHVDAIARGMGKEQYAPITVIIEVKGCWNRDVKQAMEAQLASRYLKDNSCHYGLYVVGWYLCPQWGKTDYRKRDVAWQTLDAAQDSLAAQANELTKSSNVGLNIRSFVLNVALR